jgi:hypothetical protein
LIFLKIAAADDQGTISGGFFENWINSRFTLITARNKAPACSSNSLLFPNHPRLERAVISFD